MPPLETERLTAVITAGGQSRRFGSDKALAQYQGRTLLDWAAANFEGWSARFLIAPQGKYQLVGWQTIDDTRPNQGPLAGLEAALLAAGSGWVAFTGVDLPFLTPADWQSLLTACNNTCLNTCLCVQALDPTGRPQPLVALYHCELLPKITKLLENGERRLSLAVTPKNTLFINSIEASHLKNINTLADLEES